MKPVKLLLTVLAVVAGLSVGLAGAAPDDAVQKELKALAGTWVSKPGTIEEVSFTFTMDGEYTFGIPNEPPMKGTFTIDPTRRPRTMDTVSDGVKTLYIYELKGNELTVAYDVDNPKSRPRAFSGKNVMVMKYKR
jgi:uncharacterized protein (TIGR03067 family)